MSNNPPKVSILTICYKQERYIAQALDSFLMQKTNFDFEVIIGDDASPDGTQAIIKEYAEKYPNIIKPILRKQNVGPGANIKDVYNRATGDYIAICEGDDFFTDENKLQIQVDYMETHSDVSICFHPVNVFYQNKEISDREFRPKYVSLEELIKRNFIQTNSVMARRQNYEDMPEDIMPGDWYMNLFHAQFGKIGYIDRVMSSYRKHDQGIWWGAKPDSDEIYKKWGVSQFKTFMRILKMYGDNDDYRNIMLAKLNVHLRRMIRADEKYGTTLFKDCLQLDEDKAHLLEDIMYAELLRDKKEYGFRNRLVNFVAKTLRLGRVYGKVK